MLIFPCFSPEFSISPSGSYSILGIHGPHGQGTDRAVIRLDNIFEWIKKFANFSGQDMLILQRDDFIQIGQEGPGYPNPIAECIRLYNAVRR